MRWVSLTLAFAVVCAACGAAKSGPFFADSIDEAGAGADGGSSFFDDGGTSASCDGGTSAAGGTITAAGGPNIVVHGQPASVALTASAAGAPVIGTWTTSDTAVGSVGSDGVFHANGYVGGTVDVTLLV